MVLQASTAVDEPGKPLLRWNRERGLSLLPLKLPFEIYSNNTIYAARYYKKLSQLWASHGIDALNTGPGSLLFFASSVGGLSAHRPAAA